jgi:hypothetical protein
MGAVPGAWRRRPFPALVWILIEKVRGSSRPRHVTRRSPLARTLVALFAIAQLLLPPVAALADAAIDREAPARAMPVGHIEAHTSNGCPRTHPPDCALCRAAAVSVTRPSSPTVRIATRAGSPERPVGSHAAGTSAERAWSARPRAPPALG